MTANPGDIFWLQLDAPDGQPPRIPHPYVVIETGAAGDSGGPVVLACALTTNLSRVTMPGNVLLDAGEGSLPRQSVVEVSKVARVEVARLGDYIGTLSAARVAQIQSGIRFVRASFL